MLQIDASMISLHKRVTQAGCAARGRWAAPAFLASGAQPAIRARVYTFSAAALAAEHKYLITSRPSSRSR